MQQPMDESAASLEAPAERHEKALARLDSIAKNQDQLLDRLLALQDRLAAIHETAAQFLEEVIKDAAATRRLWLRLAERFGWLDDDQNDTQPDTAT